jgi:hypothetical protein
VLFIQSFSNGSFTLAPDIGAAIFADRESPSGSIAGTYDRLVSG